MQNVTLLLVHGAWSGEWVWKDVTPILDARHTKWASLDLPGCGNNPSRGWRVTMADYANAINQVAETITGPVVLVGHSAGGFPISLAASTTATPYAGLIYLAAYLPKHGERIMTLGPKNKGSLITASLKPNIFAGQLDTAVDHYLEALYHDCSDCDTDALIKKHTPEPMRPGLARMKLTEQFDRTPKFYVECTHDRAITPDFQKLMRERYNLEPAATLDTGHMPMFAAPSETAEVLEKIASTLTN